MTTSALTRAIRALRDQPRTTGATPAPTAQVNPDPPVVCAGALTPSVRKRSDPGLDAGADVVWTELSRETALVRITATDGSGAWVEVERPTRLVFRDGDGRRLVMILNP
ncbi:MAG: hypothetical protein K9H25_16270 [Rhodospirillum sp.]|nr:hypothetical protein [Rhodospirillum sp.]MCF8489638.1 hypothetical protein [Rhodospirillum sp.]MCF8500558.1 hypothetical protein [Rhodospirillum sp.]